MNLKQTIGQMRQFARRNPCGPVGRLDIGVSPAHVKTLAIDGRIFIVGFSFWRRDERRQPRYILTLMERGRFRPNADAVKRLMDLFFDRRRPIVQQRRERGDVGMLPDVLLFEQSVGSTVQQKRSVSR